MMYNGALVEIPTMADNEAISFDRLSDERALDIGHRVACGLSEHEGHVIVTLSDGRVVALGFDTTTRRVVTGRLTRPWRGGYRAMKERKSYGTV